MSASAELIAEQARLVAAHTADPVAYKTRAAWLNVSTGVAAMLADLGDCPQTGKGFRLCLVPRPDQYYAHPAWDNPICIQWQIPNPIDIADVPDTANERLIVHVLNPWNRPVLPDVA